MSIFQVIAVLFALFMLYIVSIHKKKSALSYFEVLFWYCTWIAFILIAIFPELLLGIADTLRFARVFDLLTVIAFMIISVLVITNYFLQKENARKIEEYIRKIAISRQP